MLFPIGGRCDPHFLFEAGAEIILIGVTAFHTDFLQSHVCGCKITAGGVDSLSSDIVTDTHALFLFKEGTQISRADIGFAGDIVQAQSIAGIVFVNI